MSTISKKLSKITQVLGPLVFLETLAEDINDIIGKQSIVRNVLAMGSASTYEVVSSFTVEKLPQDEDSLRDMHEDAIAKFLVSEERAFLNSCKKYRIEAPEFTPAVFEALKDIETVYIPFRYWPDIKCHSYFADRFEPVHKHELILEGLLGTINGIKFRTDAYRQSSQQVFNDDDSFFYAFPKEVGSWESSYGANDHTVNMKVSYDLQ